MLVTLGPCTVVSGQSSFAGSLARYRNPCNKREMARPGCPIDNDNPPKRIFIHFICPSSLFRLEQPRGQSTSTTPSNADPDTLWSPFSCLHWPKVRHLPICTVLLPVSSPWGKKLKHLWYSLPQIHPWRRRAAQFDCKFADTASPIDRQPVLQKAWASGVN